MKIYPKVSSAIVATLALVVGANPAGASCNTIPSVEQLAVNGTLSSAQPSALAAAVSESAFPGPGGLGFKGALGRIDRLHFVPGLSESLIVTPDGVCVGDPAGPADPPVLPTDVDALVAVALFGTAGGQTTLARVFADRDTCRALQAAAADLSAQVAEAGQDTLFHLMKSCTNDGLELITWQGSPRALRVPVPSPQEFAEARNATDGAVVAPSTRIMVIRRAPTVASLRESLARAASTDCKSSCGGLQGQGGMICIDDIYSLRIGPGGHALYASDKVACEVLTLSQVQTTDFQEQCTSVVTGPNLTDCDDNPSTLELLEDKCGGIHIPFDWTEIRKDPQGGDPVNREVSGRSAVARKTKARNPRVWLPGREFVGTTPIADPMGTGSSVDWRLPQINVSYKTGKPQETGLRGVVDEPNSVVHIFPRILTTVLCDTTELEGCMAVEGAVKGSGIACGCTDEYAADCGCKPDDNPRYFACEGGSFAGMPCTRHRHCNPGGKCSGKPVCRAEGAVWEPGAVLGPNPQECWNDSQCDNAPGKPQCGLLLFGLSDRADPASKIIELDAKITTPPTRARRGACEATGAACSNDSAAGGPPMCAQGACWGYRLEAE